MRHMDKMLHQPKKESLRTIDWQLNLCHWSCLLVENHQHAVEGELAVEQPQHGELRQLGLGLGLLVLGSGVPDQPKLGGWSGLAAAGAQY